MADAVDLTISDGGSSEVETQTAGAWWKRPLVVLKDAPIEDSSIAERVFPMADPPVQLACTLLPFQRESLYWMKEQEHSAFRGGILADEMGLGKTVQSIALILANRTDGITDASCIPAPPAYVSDGVVAQLKLQHKAAIKAAKLATQRSKKAAPKSPSSGDPTVLSLPIMPDVLIGRPSAHSAPELVSAAEGVMRDWKPIKDSRTQLNMLAPTVPGRSTLVVCPVVALTQWRAEIVKHTLPGALSVLIYHGANRALSEEDMAKFDVVLTTYSVLEVEYRKMLAPTKVTCEYCSRLFLPEKMPVHLRYFCGPDAIKTEAQSKQHRKGSAPNSHARSAAASGSSVESESAGDASSSSDSSGSSAETASEHADDGAAVGRRRGSGMLKPAGPTSKAAAETTQKSKARSVSGTTWLGAAVGGAMPAPPSKSAARSRASKAAPRPAAALPASLPVSVDLPSCGKKRGRGGDEVTAGRSRRAASGKDEESSGEDSEFSAASSSSESSSSNGDDGDSDNSESPAIARRGSGGRQGRKPRGPRKARAPRARLSSASGTAAAVADAPESAYVPPTMKLGPLSLLQRIHWRRVICDEAHMIKNKQSTTAKAAFNLTAERKWCLSGTPLQNRVGELFSLVRFIGAHPFSSYFCKNCPCTSSEYRLAPGGRVCELCGHSPLRHFNWLNRFVLNPVKQFGYTGPGRDAMTILRNEVLDGLLLRRTKASRAADLSLPGRTIVMRDDLELDLFEHDYYEALYTQSRARFDAYVAEATVANNYAHLFDLLTRLRQAVCHPYLIQYARKAGQEGSSASSTDVCGICREAAEDPVQTGCHHFFCRLCVREYLEGVGSTALSLLRDATTSSDIVDCATPMVSQKKKPRFAASAADTSSAAAAPPIACPTCFALLTVDLQSVPASETAGSPGVGSPKGSSKSILSRLPAVRVGSSFRSSSKIEALLEELWRAQADEPGCKVRGFLSLISDKRPSTSIGLLPSSILQSIVFSQFVNFLCLIEHRLTHAGVRCVKLDGSMSIAARDRVINSFRDDPFITVFLISLKAGGVALNLTPASRIFLMDCWWNVAAEMQAMDRTHRLGQHRTIKAVRFVVRNTIEERIVALQEKKRLVFDSTIGKDETSLSKLTEEDMRFLFT